MEKSREHDESLFVLFVDLRKAYDSVPRQALWCVLERYGVPLTMVSVIKSFHKGMTAVVRVGDSLTDDIEVTNGLRQGCTLAPTLFNLNIQCYGGMLETSMSSSRSRSEIQDWKEVGGGQESKS